MSGTVKKLGWLSVAVLMLLLLPACATSSPPSPPVVAPPVKLTPLPENVRQIDLKPSADYSKRVSNWLSKVDALLSSEMPK